MDEVKINTSKTLTLTLPSDPVSNLVSVSLYHEFGDLVSGPTTATRTGTGVYTITYGQQASGIYVLNSCGKHRADFTYTVGATSYTQSQYINVYTPYTTYEDFFEQHPELEEDFGPKFDKIERQIRNLINTYCGQSFEFYPDKTITIDGNNYKMLHLPLPISNINKVTLNPGDDTEELIHDSSNPDLNNIEKVRQPFAFNSAYYIRYRNKGIVSDVERQSKNYEPYAQLKFNAKSDYKIEGDFGWQFLPENITQAANLLIADYMNNDNEYRMHGVSSVSMDAISFQIKSSFYETTGNIEADVLLMDYMLFVMDYVV